MSIKDTKTEQNLLKAFAGESQAKNRYTYFARQAIKDGYQQISELFMETAIQEEMHAKLFFKYLEGGVVEITASYPAGVIATTLENLKAAAAGEKEEWSEIYTSFEDTAKAEGFDEVATTFRMVARVEAEHEKRYTKLAENIENSKVYEKDDKVKWMCRKCGYVHEGSKAPAVCPACKHPQEYFEVKKENY